MKICVAIYGNDFGLEITCQLHCTSKKKKKKKQT